MSEKRKDNKGRILRSGESQRNDGRYMYRYTDRNGSRQCAYAKTLNELREIEDVVRKCAYDGVDYNAGTMTVGELLDSYLSSKRNLRKSTASMYKSAASSIKSMCGCAKQIKSFRPSDARHMMCELYDSGRSYSYIELLKRMLSSAFRQAIEDGSVQRNPFTFNLADVLPNDTKRRRALTGKETADFLNAAKDGLFGERYYDEILLMLYTGLRVSELYGLTVYDVDLAERCISVNKQLLYDGRLYIEKPKTDSGVRKIPIVDEAAFDVLSRVVKKRRRPQVEWIVDGYTGFLFLDDKGVPKKSHSIQHAMSAMIDEYNMSHAQKLPKITPHVLRHTYCTNMIANGVDPRTVQYLMGHGNIAVTMNVYSHIDYERAKKALKRAASE